jgi:hypothetical protein
MQLMRFLPFLVISAIGCSSNDPDSEKVRNQLNPCATKNATYVVSCVEQSGNCGPLADSVFNTDSAGAADLSSVSCDALSQDGCAARGTGCSYESQTPFAKQHGGCTVSETYMTTFAQDGSSADSIDTMRIDCGDGSWCQSTYKCRMTRQ